MKLNQKINKISTITGKLLLIFVTCSFMLACENPFVMSLLPDKNKGFYDNDNDNGVGYEHIVTFDKNHGESDTIHAVIIVKYPAKTVDELPATPVWGDYVFHSWNTNNTGDGDEFTENTNVYADITVYAKWVKGSLSGSATINPSSYRIGEKLTVNTGGITGASSGFNYQWKANGVNIADAIYEEYTVKGADAGKQISCVITHNNVAGSITATGETVPYEIKIGNVIGKEGSDAVSVNPSFGLVSANISINYTLAASKNNNRLEFSGVYQSIAPVNNAGTGVIQYSVAANDAANGVITINAIFTHSDKELDTIAFADTHNVEKIYGDIPFARTISNTGLGAGSITYTSSNTNVATVSSGSGEVTIKTAGTTTITATKAESVTHAQAIASYTLTIARKPVTITGLSAGNKEYDGTTIVSISGTPVIQVINGDNVTIVTGTAEFNNKNVENGKTVVFKNYSLTGNDKDNYELTAQPTATANISKLKLTVTHAAVNKTKKYDSTDAAGNVTQPVLQNKISNDDVHISANASYNSPNVAEANRITVVYHISGMDSANYIEPDNYEITDGVFITKADGRDVSVPAMSSKSSSNITVSHVTLTQPVYGQIAEYAIAKTSSPVPSTGWQDSNIFNGLDAGTNYYVFARSKENANVNTGTAKVSAAIGTNAAAGAPTPFTKIDFQNDNTGSTTKYVSTTGNGTASLSIVSDSTPAGNRALQLVTSNYNQAAIIPINLPYELHEYAKISIRIRPTSGTTALNGKSLQIYAGGSPSDFPSYAFGNETDAQHSMVPRRIGRSSTLNFGQDPYMNVWTTFELTNIAASGSTIVGNLKGNAYIAVGLNVDNTAGTYLIDDIDFILRDGFEPPPPPPMFPQPPTTGAVTSGNYRNVFLERGLWTQQEITAKVNQSWNRLFNDASETYRIYYETSGGDMAFILDTGNNDVRSEGMSYGMMMAVQMNDQTKFDKLWKWSRTYMYNVTNVGKNSRGYFAWQVNGTAPYNKIDVGPAPDGEFYFATALLFAHARWGSTETGGQVNNSSGSGTTALFNYRKHAMMLLYDMIHRDTAKGDNYGEPSMIRRTAPGQYMPVFQPQGNAGTFTDPSYHLPSFYEIWVYEMEKDADAGTTHGVWSTVQDMKDDVAFYRNVVSTSRSFFDKALHPVTGLNADYTTFDGAPTGNQNYFGYDAFRTIKNIAMDYAWWAADAKQKEYADRLQAFFHGQGVNTYKALWNIDGTPRNPHGDHSPGLVACNAAASLAATNDRAWDFIEDFWSISMTPGQYRYYDGCLYMFGMLHLSGNFKAYLSGSVAPSSSINPTSATFTKSSPANITVTMTLNGNTFSNIQNNGANLTQGTNYTVNGNNVTIYSTYLATLSNGAQTLTFNFSAGSSRTLIVTVSDGSTSGGTGGGTSYDFTTDAIDTTTITTSGAGTFSFTYNASEGVLQVEKTNTNHSTPIFEIPFSLGSANLNSFTKVIIEIRGVTGDFTNKNLQVVSGTTQIGTIASALSTTFKTLTINLSSIPSATGEIKLGFRLDNTAGYTIQIKSIKLE